MTAKDVEKALMKIADKNKGEFLARFFKTGKGQYSEGDVFLGITVPAQRKVVAEFRALPLDEVGVLLASKYHEFRLTALLILVWQYEKCEDVQLKKRIVDFYLKNRKFVNNWDLVDSSARQVLGDWLLDKDRAILYKFAVSKDLWERRISIIATHRFIMEKDFADTLKICEILMGDRHDLIHKATGWMLREIGKRDPKPLRGFLDKHSKKMPRTMLRYAIEHLTPTLKKKYMSR
ncbi:DNA alkylation repair protein [Candidatus Peregrinibacteria bacterium]|nr:DNA alkylation repair protein [Candidatus Peregrinibacteria bacterium]